MSLSKKLSMVTAKGQITLPKNIWNKLNIKPGDYNPKPRKKWNRKRNQSSKRNL